MSAVLDFQEQTGDPPTRSAIAQLTGHGRATVNRYVDELVAAGVLVERYRVIRAKGDWVVELEH